MIAEPNIASYTVSTAEGQAIDELADRLCGGHADDDDGLFTDLRLQAALLPAGVREFMTRAALAETTDVIVVRGRTLDDEALGPTPIDWTTKQDTPASRREAVILALCASLIGEVFGWESQRNGRIVQDVMPIKGMEKTVASASSTATLTMHTEDASHPARADYIGLGCVRNTLGVPTTVARPTFASLTREDLDTLQQPRFDLADDNGSETMLAAVLFGSADDLEMRIDTEFTRARDNDGAAQAALERLRVLIAESEYRLALEPGDLCFIDNHRAVHGRGAFEPKYDGTDRWLKRVNVTRDLRKSRALRRHAGSRVVG